MFYSRPRFVPPMSPFSPAVFLVRAACGAILRQIKKMNSKRGKWFSGYYIIIIILFLLVGLFIWFSFRAILSDLERKKEDTYKNKTSSSVPKANDFVMHH